MSQATALWLSLLFLLGNAYFVGSEFAVMAARRSQLEPMAASGSKRAQVALQALERVSTLLTTAQLGITVCSLLLGAVAEAVLDKLIHPVLHDTGLPQQFAQPIALVVALLIVAYCHVVIGEMVPKNLAIVGPDKAALLLAPPLLYLTKALRPVVRLMEHIAKRLVRMFGVEPRDEVEAAFTAEEVQLIVAESRREGLIPEERHGLVRGALEFSGRVARDVAVPTSSVVTLPVGATPADLERHVAKRGFSRYPVTDGSGDLVGYIHLKDVLYAVGEQHDEPIPPKRIRRLATVSEDDEVEDVLSTMQRTGAHLARVVQGDGAVTGVVFLEDVLEELVGEVSDASQR
ncbi:MAG TPA: hemolysin family protein [Segeticoccus sp.]|uniref:hemolysin family protein n=1 Tax=Segeticoccus sp. TaxID=2706531 RepID=UPI002D7E1B16|nr:hemolysin family protein [Segeticoccus sp.]HET8599538.1 hemolysin family protein [Segeticoccus sp.]